MAYNSIQLFALQIPTKISLTFDLYALAVPKKWKDLFSRLQKYKHDKNYVLPPIECLNQALTIWLNCTEMGELYAKELEQSSKALLLKTFSVKLSMNFSIIIGLKYKKFHSDDN